MFHLLLTLLLRPCLVAAKDEKSIRVHHLVHHSTTFWICVAHRFQWQLWLENFAMLFLTNLDTRYLWVSSPCCRSTPFQARSHWIHHKETSVERWTTCWLIMIIRWTWCACGRCSRWFPTHIDNWEFSCLLMIVVEVDVVRLWIYLLLSH
jgi:hypothetical protein